MIATAWTRPRAPAAGEDGSRSACTVGPVGSKGSKPRKPSHSQHLPKVGTSTENERLLHDERAAIADTMGFGNASSWVKIAVVLVSAAIFAFAILAFISL